MAKDVFRFSTNELKKKVREKLMENDMLAYQTMADVGHFLRSEAQKRTPIDEGTLTNDLDMEIQHYTKSIAAIVFIPVNAPSAAYAIPMHEHQYNLGEKSEKKEQKVGVQVGRKYLERALFDNREKIYTLIEARLLL